MNGMGAQARAWLVWLIPIALIAAVVGWETDWGRAWTPAPALDGNVVPQPVNVSLLPEYKLAGSPAERRETVDRTLFNPTRRPAPPQAAQQARTALQRGQFVLTGTTVVDKRATAFLREVNGGRARRVQKGETINGMLVAEVTPDHVKLAVGDESEELSLKVAAGPRVTVQPVVPVTAAAGTQPGGAVPGAPVPGQPTVAAPPQQPVAQDVGEVLANRRRAARAAEAAANAAVQQPPPQPAQPAAAAPAPTDPGWNNVYQQYQQQRR